MTMKTWMPGGTYKLRSLRKADYYARAARWNVRETTYETIRPHRKAARHQARQRLELEIYLRKDRRLLRGPDRRRRPWPDETDKTASRQRRRVVRALQVGNRDAQRDADAR